MQYTTTVYQLSETLDKLAARGTDNAQFLTEEEVTHLTEAATFMREMADLTAQLNRARQERAEYDANRR